MPTTLLTASNNAHKVVEFRRLLAHLPYDIVTPSDIGLKLEVEETGETFAENAMLKARAFSEAADLPALADDSGIEVDALDGGPSVKSARYGGPGLDDEGRVQLLLKELADVPDDKRTCRYRVVLVVSGLDDEDLVAEGRCEGQVAHEPVGANGFGYDPVFYVPDFEKTIAQLSPDEKDQISHRGIATRAMSVLLAERASFF